MTDFPTLLSRSGLRKTELARRLGLDETTPSKWGNDAPRYATAYLELYVLVKEMAQKI